MGFLVSLAHDFYDTGARLEVFQDAVTANRSTTAWVHNGPRYLQFRDLFLIFMFHRVHLMFVSFHQTHFYLAQLSLSKETPGLLRKVYYEVLQNKIKSRAIFLTSWIC